LTSQLSVLLTLHLDADRLVGRGRVVGFRGFHDRTAANRDVLVIEQVLHDGGMVPPEAAGAADEVADALVRRVPGGRERAPSLRVGGWVLRSADVIGADIPVFALAVVGREDAIIDSFVAHVRGAGRVVVADDVGRVGARIRPFVAELETVAEGSVGADDGCSGHTLIRPFVADL
jgi:hypothetical protein